MKYLLALALILVGCDFGSDSPEIKTASFNLKEACTTGAVTWKPAKAPLWWNAYLATDKSRVPYTGSQSFDGAVVFECPVGKEGTIDIFYQ